MPPALAEDITDNPPADRLAGLTHRRWAIPVLAELASTGGCKLVWLERHVGAGRGAAKIAVTALIGLGLARPNPGYGHPLRPEYLPTPQGQRLQPALETIEHFVAKREAADLVYRKWSLPVLLAVHSGGHRFGAVRAALPGATDRAISRALQELETQRWVIRRVTNSRPPRPNYAVAQPAVGLARACAELVERWDEPNKPSET